MWQVCVCVCDHMYMHTTTFVTRQADEEWLTREGRVLRCRGIPSGSAYATPGQTLCQAVKSTFIEASKFKNSEGKLFRSLKIYVLSCYVL